MKTIFQKQYISCALALTLISVFSFGQDALTLRSNTEGFHIGLGASYKHWVSSYFNRLDEIEPTGLGGGLNLGFGLNQHIELFANVDYHTFALKNDWDDYKLTALGVGVRYNFGGTLQAIRPYGELAYNYQSLTINPVELNGQLFKYEMKGGSLGIGGGVNFFVKPRLAINAKAGATIGKFSSFLLNGDGIEDRPDVKVFQFGVGVSYFFN
jgi:hypothetical protein